MTSIRNFTSPIRFAIALAAFASTFGVARVASASNVTLAFSAADPNPTWATSAGVPLQLGQLRPVGFNPYGVSFSDCENDSQLQFPISATYSSGGAGADTLQVWAGAVDCTEVANRANGAGTLGACVPVTAPITLNQVSLTVPIFVRDIAMAIQSEAPAGSGGVVSFTSVHASGDAACFRQVGPTGTSIGLYFLPFPAGSNTSDPALAYLGPIGTGVTGTSGILVDLVGPIAPTGGTLAADGDAVDVRWYPAGDSDSQGFEVFCDPNAIDGDAGLAPIDAQCAQETTVTSGDAAPASAPPVAPCDAPLDFDAGTCSSPLLGASGGNGSQIPAAYVCSPMLLGNTSSTYQVQNVAAGAEHAYAVAGFDSLLNVGAVDVVGCEQSGETVTAGGAASGGGCAIDGVRTPAGSMALLGGLALGAVVLVRRRRARR